MTPIQQLPSFWTPQAPAAPVFATALPGSPTNGQQVIYVDSLTNATYRWQLVYNANSTSAYKWEAIGATPMVHEVPATETTASTSYVNLATDGPTRTVPLAGDYDILFGSTHWQGGAGAWVYVSLSIAGSVPSDGDAIDTFGLNALAAGAKSLRKTGLAAGNVVKMQYKASGGQTPSFQGRWLHVKPVRVG